MLRPARIGLYSSMSEFQTIGLAKSASGISTPPGLLYAYISSRCIKTLCIRVGG